MSEPQLETVAATLLAYLAASGALRATALVAPGAVVEADAEGTVTVQGGEAEEADPQPLDPGAARPLELGMRLRVLPPMDVDPVLAEVRGPMGGLEHLAEGVQALARALGERSAVVVRFPAADGETDFALSAREGAEEGMVVVIGDDQFEMAPGWPERRGAGRG